MKETKERKWASISSSVAVSLSGRYLPPELHLMTPKLGQSQSKEGGKDNEKGQRENATWQAISRDRKTKTDEREKANLCGEKRQYRQTEGKTRRTERRPANAASLRNCILTTFSPTVALLR